MNKQSSKFIINFVPVIVLFLNGCSSGEASGRSNPQQNISYYQNWVDNLTSYQYDVAQGNAFLMQNTDCPTFVAIFNSCFGQNPASPYIIPQPPIGKSYVNPYYAESLEAPGPDGLTDIFYHLSNNDALITIISYPPKAAYLGYQSYVFTSESSNYIGIAASRERTISPDPSRYDIFGSIGNDINSVIVQNQYGTSPWGGNIIMYITTPNQILAKALIANASSYGINPQSIFIEPVGSNVITGNESTADDMITLMRYAVPESPAASTSWQSSLKNNVLVYKVTNVHLPVSRYAQNQYTAHTVNTVESPFATALGQLATLLQNYLAQNQPGTLDAISYQTQATTTVNSNGIPESGLVGSSCIQEGTDCEGDNQDTSTYATLIESVIILGPEENAFIAGVNHSLPNINNNHYLSVDIYNASNSSGVASSSQTDLTATGFASGILNGSAQQVLNDLGITIPESNTALNQNISNLYVTFISRNCKNFTTMSAKDYCINLMGTSLIPESSPISITERSYVMPNTTTGGYAPSMVYPYIIAGAHNFIGN